MLNLLKRNAGLIFDKFNVIQDKEESIWGRRVAYLENKISLFLYIFIYSLLQHTKLNDENPSWEDYAVPIF